MLKSVLNLEFVGVCLLGNYIGTTSDMFFCSASRSASVCASRGAYDMFARFFVLPCVSLGRFTAWFVEPGLTF